MKQAFTIVAAVGLLALVGCGGSTEPTATITVTATPSPTASPSPSYTPEPAPTASFTSDEQRNFDFIVAKYPVLAEEVERVMELENEDDVSDYEMLSRVGRAADDFIPISKKWNRIEWSYGETDRLEESFNSYVNAVRAYYRNWLSLLTESYSDFNQCCENIWKAEDKIEKFGPRIEREIERLEGSESA